MKPTRPLLSPVILFSLLPTFVQGATYTVRAGGGGDYTTIQACANAAAAGDTCQVSVGTYDERVTVSSSGSAGRIISFIGGSGCSTPGTCPKARGFTVSSSNAYVSIDGFEISQSGTSADTSPAFVVSGTDHVSILNNYVHDTCSGTTGKTGVSASGSSPKATFTHISGNTFTNIGCPGNRLAIIGIWFDNALIEYNDASHSSDFVNTMGHMNVIRHNAFHDFLESDTQSGNNHIDFWQTYCGGSNPAAEEGNRTLLEGNYQYAAEPTSTNSHFVIVNTSSSCGNSYNVIARHNTGYHNGAAFYQADDSDKTDSYHKLYNNTVVSAYAVDHISSTLSGVAHGSILNNIFYDAILNSSTYDGYRLNTDGHSNGDYNLGYMSSGPKTWSADMSTGAHNIVNRNPLFVDAAGNFDLQSSSPARGAGGPLTSVAAGDAGSGTSLVVADAAFFQPGWAGVKADWIRVGASTTAQISSIDYSTNTITLASGISRSQGDPVYLYKDSSGKVVLLGSTPDIGALQYEPAPPMNLTAISR